MGNVRGRATEGFETSLKCKLCCVSHWKLKVGAFCKRKSNTVIWDPHSVLWLEYYDYGNGFPRFKNLSQNSLLLFTQIFCSWTCEVTSVFENIFIPLYIWKCFQQIGFNLFICSWALWFAHMLVIILQYVVAYLSNILRPFTRLKAWRYFFKEHWA